jgi:hypothetical protein
MADVSRPPDSHPESRGPAAAPRHRRRRSRPEANARLTGALAAILLLLLAAEGVTVLRVGQLLTAHVVIGLILVPPVLAKIGSTSWRFVRYYGGDPEYRKKGPPKPILRVLGPLVVVLTAVLFASGIALLLAPSSWRGTLLFVHRASFFLWLAVMAVHVLGHLVETGRLAPQDWMRRTSRRVGGAGARRLLIVATIVVGVVLAMSLVGNVQSYRQHDGRFFKGPGGPPPRAAGRP